MKKSLLLLSFALWVCIWPLQAQMQNPVTFKSSIDKKDNNVKLLFNAAISKGWHLYSVDIPDGGPTAATITFETLKGAQVVGKLTPVGAEKKAHDAIFDMDVRFFEGSGGFSQALKLTGGAYRIQGYLEYGACNDQNCMPPTKVEFDYTGEAATSATPAATKNAAAANLSAKGTATPAAATTPSAPATPAATAPTEVVPAAQQPDSLGTSAENGSFSSYWTPVVDKLRALGDNSQSSAHHTLLWVFIMGFAGGLLALLTPCVWPIIPMTVSFFLKRSKDKKRAIRDAWIYGVSIIVIYLALGLAITLIFGASALNALSTNAIFNIFFCLLLLLFAASFLGGFELTLPSSWSNKVDSKAEETTGLLSIFLMAFTLTLVSFSCTGPIIGFLLVEVSTSGTILSPAIGMLGFAIALALPFTLFAMFPSWLKQMPKSGNWLNEVKVILGFIELAFALKFFSVADLAYGWGLLDRETFLCLWIIIFTLLGLYLLGIIRFPHDEVEDETSRKVGIPNFFMALVSLAFAIYMVPGLWGAPCKAVSAFSPPMSTQDFNLYTHEVKAQFNDYDAGMEYARRQGKPVMLDFTGYGCVNCRKMELAVWTDDRVAGMMNDDYVLITMFVDDKTPLPQPMEVNDNGTVRKLRTVGDKWSYLQRSKFGANAQPFYVLLDNDGNPLTSSYSYDEDVAKYQQFLKRGLEQYNRKKQ